MGCKWEYDKQTVKASELEDDIYIKKLLNRMGAERWELVCCLRVTQAKPEFHLIFKRPDMVIGALPPVPGKDAPSDEPVELKTKKVKGG